MKPPASHGFASRSVRAHRILSWTGDKPTTGLAAAAREARHELLAEAAAAEKTDLVLTGHTADDQAETVLMRQARGEIHDGGRGLAGIAPATLFDGKVWFARPLLTTRREALARFPAAETRSDGSTIRPTSISDMKGRASAKKLGEANGGETAIAEALKTADRGGQTAGDFSATPRRN